MSAVDYLLHESSVGYAIFQVVHQADTIGNRLKEVQDASQDLAKFGKMVKLVNFAPYRYTLFCILLVVPSNIRQRSCGSSREYQSCL
jgi:NOP5NT (NUC127) domain